MRQTTYRRSPETGKINSGLSFLRSPKSLRGTTTKMALGEPKGITYEITPESDYWVLRKRVSGGPATYVESGHIEDMTALKRKLEGKR